MYGDPSAIRRLAGRLVETAAQIRTEADRLVTRTDAVGWLGHAGDALRERVRERALALRRAAALHDDAADALEHHAREVERFQRLIEEVERRALRFLEAARGKLDDWLDDGLGDGGRRAGRRGGRRVGRLGRGLRAAAPRQPPLARGGRAGPVTAWQGTPGAAPPIPTPEIAVTEVTGGSHGMTVAAEHALALAGDYDEAADRLRARAADDAGVLLDPDLLESALLAPVSFAAAEAAVLAATAGPDGVVTAAAFWEADAVTIRTAVRATQLTDELAARAMSALDHQLGHLAGQALAVGAPLVVASGAGLAVIWSELPAETREGLAEESLARLQQWIDDHPEALQRLAGAGGGVLEGLWDGLTPVVPGGPARVPLLVPDTEAAAALLTLLYGVGHAVTTPSPLVPAGSAQGSTEAPADLAGLLHHLEQVSALTQEPGGGGTVEVQTIRGADGSVRHVVYLPGTDDLATTPWSQDADVRDLGTNLLLVSGRDNAYQQGVLDALGQAGVGPDEPVALVGHSQGGMVAAAIASQGSPYTVTHVVTAGAPTAHLDGFPAGTHVLSLENHGDVVPLLDGEDNPDTAEQVTVRLDDGRAGVVGDHDLGRYADGARAVQASDDPSVRDHLQSLAAGGFVGSATGQEVTSQVFRITRGG